jgi:hypothetical protein
MNQSRGYRKEIVAGGAPRVDLSLTPSGLADRLSTKLPLLADCVAKVVLQKVLKILRAGCAGREAIWSQRQLFAPWGSSTERTSPGFLRCDRRGTMLGRGQNRAPLWTMIGPAVERRGDRSAPASIAVTAAVCRQGQSPMTRRWQGRQL